MLAVDLTSPNERSRRERKVASVKQNNLEAARKAQIESQVAARKKAQKRKEMTERRALKRQAPDARDNEEPETKKKKNEGRIIDFTERDFEHVKRLFNAVLTYFGNLNVVGIFCGYDCAVCPTIVYPIFVSAQDEKKQSVYSRKFILGVGKSSNVFTGIRQAFTELYPEYPADRVYDWKLMKWNKKAYKAVTSNVAVDPDVLSQRLFSSKSFGGAKSLPDVKVTDEIASSRKRECAIEVATYIKDFVPERIKNEFPKDFRTWSIADVVATLEAVSEKEKLEKELENEICGTISTSDTVKEAFDRIEKQKSETGHVDSESEEGEYSEESD